MRGLAVDRCAGMFELNAVSAVALASGSTAMGIRMGFPHPALGLFDGAELVVSMDAICGAPGGRYCRCAWRVPVTAEGVKRFAAWPSLSLNAPVVCDYASGEAACVVLQWHFDGATVVGSYSADHEVSAALLVNGCFRDACIESLAADRAVLRQDDARLAVTWSGHTARPLAVDRRDDAEKALLGGEYGSGCCIAAIPIELAPNQPLHFAMTLNDASTAADVFPACEPEAVEQRLQRQAETYEQQRMYSSGVMAQAAEAVASLAAYSRAYDPVRRRLQTTVNRTWGNSNAPGLIFGWDNFFDSYIAAWEDPELGAASLEHIVAVYGEHGIARGPCQRNLIIPVMYCRTLDVVGDTELARRTWPTMMEFMRFWFSDRGDGYPWRDGNRDGLIESGANDPGLTPGRLVQAAMDETGYDDIPIYSAGFTNGRRGLLPEGVTFDAQSGCLTVTLVGQNSLYCAACKTMARWARRLGNDGDAQWLQKEADRVAERMREQLFDETAGYYRDRQWDGQFRPVKTPTLFYPLLAGVADQRTAESLRQTLLDPQQFWGEHVIPTVSRDAPEYCDGLDGAGNYWRGNIWPPMAYIVYLGLKEAGWDQLAARYARRTCAQFMAYWHAHCHAYENYPPEGEVDHRFLYVQGWGGRELRYVWAAMMVFCALEEVFAPELSDDGYRFGNPYLSGNAGWHQFTVAGNRVEASAGPSRTSVRFGEQWAFDAEPGIVVRHFTRTRDGFAFSASAPEDAQVRFRAAGLPKGGRICIDSADIGVTAQPASQRSFTLPAGRRHVSLA